MACTDGSTIGMHPYTLLIVNGIACYWLTVYCLWCAFMWTIYNYGYTVSLSSVLLYHYICLLIILQDMAPVLPFCADLMVLCL